MNSNSEANQKNFFLVRDATIQDTRRRAKEAADLSDFGTATRAPNDLLGTTTKSNKTNAETTIEKLEKLRFLN